MADPHSFIPNTIKTYLQRRVVEILGLLVLTLGLVLLVMLVSYDSQDPSGSTTSSINQSRFNNLLGPIGAEISSKIIEFIGIVAAHALAFVPVVWGVRIIRHHFPKQWKFRLFTLFFAIILISFLSTAIMGGRGGAGGVTGTLVHSWVIAAGFLQIPLPDPLGALVWAQILIMILILKTLLLYSYAAAIGWDGVRLLPILASGIKPGLRGLLGIAFKAGRYALFWQRRNLKTMTVRKTPAPRRDPVVITSESTEAEALSRTGAKPKKSPTLQKQPMLNLENQSGYRLPSLDLLSPPVGAARGPDEAVLDTNSRMLESVLAEFGVRGEIHKARFGPVVTRYELVLAPGIKSQRVIGLADDIARSMSALSVRIAVVPGENVIGIELPNVDRQIVMLRDIFDGKDWEAQSALLPMALGMDIAGKAVITDLSRMPHLLVAGTTGSGKSVGINAMILSLLYTHTPETCRFIMIDPKMLELSVYDGIPHLLTPVVTDSGKAVTALKWAVREMESRYRNMAKLGVRNIEGYNKQIEEARRKGETLTRRVHTGFDAETAMPVYEEEALDLTPLPFIVVIIDEVADLMLVAGKDIEAAVQRLAQMARAAGIHVVMATQRPSVDVITGTIKANFPTRISFQVTSKIDSRTILGEQGSEQLLGRGDMLFMEGGGRIVRVHGPFVDDHEVEGVTNFLRRQGEPVYNESVTIETSEEGKSQDLEINDNSDASLYDQAVSLVTREGKASTSFIQRHLRIGYNRAATIIEEMERNGVVSPANHAGKREVLIDVHE